MDFGNTIKGKGIVYCLFFAFGHIRLAARGVQERFRVYKILFAAEMSNCVL